MTEAKKPIEKDVLIKELMKHRDDEKMIEKILEEGRGSSHGQSYLGDTFGNLLQKLNGKADIKTSEDLNNYLQNNLIKNNYSGIQDLRKAINPEAKNLNSSFKSGFLGNASYIPYLRSEDKFPITLGNTPYDMNPEQITDRIVGTLSHETGHAQDHLVQLLKRGQEVHGDKYVKDILDKISKKHGQYSSDTLEAVNNTPNQFTSRTANNLTPDKLEKIRNEVLKQDPSSHREETLRFIDRYEKAINSPVPSTPDSRLMARDLNLPENSLTPYHGSNAHFALNDNINKDVTEDTLKYNKLQAQSHHLPRLDIPNDIGHFEWRNLLRSLKGQKLKAIAPIVGAGLAGGLPLAAEAASEGFDAEALGSPEGSPENDIEMGISPEERAAKIQRQQDIDAKNQMYSDKWNNVLGKLRR